MTTRAADRKGLQALHQTHDSWGHVSHLRDKDVYFRNAVLRPDQAFPQDGIHRFIRAKGRAHPQMPGPVQTSVCDPIGDDRLLAAPHAEVAAELLSASFG